MIANQTLFYPLPQIKDDQGDEYTVLAIFGEAIQFSSKVGQKLKFAPKSGQEGEYIIQIMLKDQNIYNPKETLNQFKLTIYKAPDFI